MPSLKKLLSPSKPLTTTSSPPPSASQPTKTTTTKTTTSPNGTKTITKTTTTTPLPNPNPQQAKHPPLTQNNNEVEITGPGSNPQTNKNWMGDSIPIMGRNMVPAIVGQDQLSPEELARMGIVPRGRWVKVGTTTTTRTVKSVKKVTRTRRVTREEGIKEKEKEEDTGLRKVEGKKGEEKEKEKKREEKDAGTTRGVKDKGPESSRTKGNEVDGREQALVKGKGKGTIK